MAHAAIAESIVIPIGGRQQIEADLHVPERTSGLVRTVTLSLPRSSCLFQIERLRRRS